MKLRVAMAVVLLCGGCGKAGPPPATVQNTPSAKPTAVAPPTAVTAVATAPLPDAGAAAPSIELVWRVFDDFKQLPKGWRKYRVELVVRAGGTTKTYPYTTPRVGTFAPWMQLACEGDYRVQPADVGTLVMDGFDENLGLEAWSGLVVKRGKGGELSLVRFTLAKGTCQGVTPTGDCPLEEKVVAPIAVPPSSADGKITQRIVTVDKAGTETPLSCARARP
ncbi:MAG: hypothetical protein HOO96_02450 [Polyangiaceae bacterium]|nr:hypothetical protein [Polyangiaceae bacterium]